MAETLPAILSDIPAPAMPTCELYAPLLRVRSWRDDGRIEWDVHVSPKHHIDRGDCGKILAELEHANLPATMAVATRITKLLIGAYRKADLADPATFVRIIAATFAEYPSAIALQAADDLTRTCRWIPSRAEVIEACDKRMLERKYAAHVVRAHLDQHDENDRRREARKRWLEARAKHYDQNPHHRVFDRWWQMFPPYRQNREQWEWRIKRLIEEFGEPAVDGWHRDVPAEDAGTDYRLQAVFQRLSQAARAPTAPAGEQQP